MNLTSMCHCECRKEAERSKPPFHLATPVSKSIYTLQIPKVISTCVTTLKRTTDKSPSLIKEIIKSRHFLYFNPNIFFQKTLTLLNFVSANFKLQCVKTTIFNHMVKIT